MASKRLSSSIRFGLDMRDFRDVVLNPESIIPTRRAEVFHPIPRLPDVLKPQALTYAASFGNKEAARGCSMLARLESLWEDIRFAFCRG